MPSLSGLFLDQPQKCSVRVCEDWLLSAQSSRLDVWRLEPRSNNYHISNYQQTLTSVILLHDILMSSASSQWRFSITRSVNTPLPAPWQHSWECRMFTCLETVYLTTNLNISLLHLVCHICIQYIYLLLQQNFNIICCFLLEKALDCIVIQTSVTAGVTVCCQRQ